MRPLNEKQPLLLTLREVAESLGIGLRSLHRHIRVGHFPKPIRLGGTLRYSREAIAQWIEARSKEVGDE